VLVNNAGMIVTRPFEQVTSAESRREQLVNLQAPMQLSRALYPALRRASGRIVSVVSLGAMMPLAESAGYSASKAGLRTFMLALAMLERQTGVGISMVHPGAVDTPMLRHEAAGGGSALNFLSRPLHPDTVAQAVVANLDRPRLETSIPRYDGWLLKMIGLTPGVLPGIRPLLERLAQPGLRKYRQQHGIL
jgi:short-subunit dehydrogenase